MITKTLPGDDQDLDDRVIRQLWEDNKELREEVGGLSSIKNWLIIVIIKIDCWIDYWNYQNWLIIDIVIINH